MADNKPREIEMKPAVSAGRTVMPATQAIPIIKSATATARAFLLLRITMFESSAIKAEI